KCWGGCREDEILEAIGIEKKEIKQGKDNTAKKLIELVERFELWVNQNGEEYISLPEGNLRIDSKDFRKYLQLTFYQRYGKIAHTQAVVEAVATLAGKALFEGKRYKSFVRIGKTEDFIEIDLCNGYAVRIERENIQIIKPYCKFAKSASALPLPVPDLNIEGDEWKLLKHFINTNDEGVVLILGWLLGTFNLDGEFPILNIVGEREGIGKTTTSKFLKSIVDPAVVLTKPLPKTEDDLLTVCLHNHIVAFDNISTISDAISDALCRISTGSGLAKRRLYTDADAVLYFVKNPIILNGIDFFAERRDLRRRCIHVELKRLERPIPIEKLESDFAGFHSKLLGWLCRAVQLTLREEMDKEFNLTDMASFVSFICRTEKVFPISANSFVELFNANRFHVSVATISENPLVNFLLELTENRNWAGTISELHEVMVQKFQNSHVRNQLPKDAKSLSRKIRRILTDLENINIVCEFFRDSKHSYIHIKKIEKNITTTPLSPQPLKNKDFSDGDIMVKNGDMLNNTTISPLGNSLKNKIYGDNGVMVIKNPSFLTDDVIDGSDINPDEIEILEDDEVEG
ncbi:MAG: hypothetical protein NZ893_02620, partial [Candidatus Aenigmarchaeota archaeon]|nr:hypothetical protein [Candidatus Aenigmarchaeota archaeon]